MRRINSLFIFSVLPLTVEGITTFLKMGKTNDKTGSELYICGSSNNFNQSIICLKEKQPDIFLINDACLNKKKLYKFINDLSGCISIRRIVICTDSNDSAYLRKLINLNIRTIIHKKTLRKRFTITRDLLQSIGAYIDEHIAPVIYKENLVNNISNEDKIKLLTGREREIFNMRRAGMNYREIAKRLFISKRTVEKHCDHLANKFGLPGRSYLIEFILGENNETELL